MCNIWLVLRSVFKDRYTEQFNEFLILMLGLRINAKCLA